MKKPTHTRKKQTLKRKLFAYMVILAVILLTLIFAGVFLIGGFTNTKKNIADILSFQTEIFERQVSTYYDGLVVMSVQLSRNTSKTIDAYLENNGITFDMLKGSDENIEAIQNELIASLKQSLFEADCTGNFIILNTQVNPSVENAEFSRSGIYLQRNSLEADDTRVLLYRGLSDVGKNNDCMPHRKWRLEFSTDNFPNYNEIVNNASFPLRTSYRITDVALLTGTDQHVMLMAVPVKGSDGTFYGICGFEINEGYFKQNFAQPSEFNRAVFCLSKGSDGLGDSAQTLSAGVLNDYYLEPTGVFESESFGNGLTLYENDTTSYIGITKEIELCPGECESSLSVLMLKEDYDHALFEDMLRTVVLLIILTVLAIGLALLFAHRYLNPLKKNIEQIRQKNYDDNTGCVIEIDDLFAFLAEQDRLNEEAVSKAEKDKNDALSTILQMQTKYDEASKQAERLAYSRLDEIDPLQFEAFKKGLALLTEKEYQIFELYLQGKTAKEILDILNIRESTLKFHNHNMLGKLGVPSRKQMLRFATLIKQEQEQE